MRCNNCGAMIEDGSLFCGECGKKVEIVQQQSVTKGKSNTALIVIIVLLVVVVIALIGIVAMTMLKDNKSEEVSATPEVQVVIATPEPGDDAIQSIMYVVNCNEYITLRTAPSTSASEITKIPLGSGVGYIEPALNGFNKVNYNGVVGYALASYMSPNQQLQHSRPAPPQNIGYTTMTVVNCNEWISLRTTPSTSATRIIEIPLGAKVTYLGPSSNGFYHISYNGYTGYALAQYLR